MGNTCCCCSSKKKESLQHNKTFNWSKKIYFFNLANNNRTGLYEPLLQESEREAITELLQYLESKIYHFSFIIYLFTLTFFTYLDRNHTNFFDGQPLRALATLAFSDNVDLQRSAALAFAEITEKGFFNTHKKLIACNKKSNHII